MFFYLHVLLFLSVLNVYFLCCSPVAESRRVLQESCEFFIKQNSNQKHKKKHHRSSSHNLKVLSKSMGTSTGAKTNHGASVQEIVAGDGHGRETVMDVRSTGDLSPREDKESGSSILRGRAGHPAEETTLTLLETCEAPTQPEESNDVPLTVRGNGLSGSAHRLIEGR